MNRTVGRPRGFDEEAVLDTLTALFWQNGYSQTSMSDIEAATNVHRPTLYRVFGTKDQMFEIVLRRYINERLKVSPAPAHEGPTGIAPLRALLESYKPHNLSTLGRHGCLVVAAMGELHGTHVGFEDFATSYRDALRATVTPIVANSAPGLEPEIVAQRTEIFVTLLIGLLVAIRSQAKAAELEKTIDAIAAVLDSWEQPAGTNDPWSSSDVIR